MLISAWSNAEGAQRVSELFQRIFNQTPDTICAAPGRLNIIGEHTDYNQGLCAPMALDHRTFVALRYRTDDIVRVHSAQLPHAPWEGKLSDIFPGNITGWAGYAVGPAWSLGITYGFDAVIDTCVPFGAGLSSSAAIECAMALAMDKEPDTLERREVLVKACIRAENEIAGAATGGLDQTTSLFAKHGNALRLDFQDGSREDIPCDFEAFGLTLLTIDTKTKHALNDGQFANRRAKCTQAAQELGISTLRAASLTDLERLTPDLAPFAKHVITDNRRVDRISDLLRHNKLRDIGPLLTQSHISLRDDFQVSCPELDLAVDTALDFGAYGARMVGGGFGGSAIALISSTKVKEIAEHIIENFAKAGFNTPEFLTTKAAPSAQKLH